MKNTPRSSRKFLLSKGVFHPIFWDVHGTNCFLKGRRWEISNLANFFFIFPAKKRQPTVLSSFSYLARVCCNRGKGLLGTKPFSHGNVSTCRHLWGLILSQVGWFLPKESFVRRGVDIILTLRQPSLRVNYFFCQPFGFVLFTLCLVIEETKRFLEHLVTQVLFFWAVGGGGGGRGNWYQWR